MKNWRTWRQFKKQLLKDPEAAKAYQELEPEFVVIENVIRMRLKKGLTQAQLARRMKTKQSAISRLESGLYNPSLRFLKKLASVLESRLEIRLIPS